jgi:hypothetical protein
VESGSHRAAPEGVARSSDGAGCAARGGGASLSVREVAAGVSAGWTARRRPPCKGRSTHLLRGARWDIEMPPPPLTATAQRRSGRLRSLPSRVLSAEIFGTKCGEKSALSGWKARG